MADEFTICSQLNNWYQFVILPDTRKGLVARVTRTEGTVSISLTRALAVVNCQSALAWCLLRWSCHAVTSWARICLWAMRRSRHCDARTPSSDSAMSSQLPCLGV